MNQVKMTSTEATEILYNVWDYATTNDDKSADTLETALDVACFKL